MGGEGGGDKVRKVGGDRVWLSRDFLYSGYVGIWFLFGVFRFDGV